jgi:hypothetical protein
VQDCRILRDICGDEVVGHDIAQQLKPEERELGQDFAFAGNAGGEHVVEGGDAVRGDEEERFADGIKVADFAAREQRKAGEIGLGECLQRELLPWSDYVIDTSIFGAGSGFVNARAI